ncbi:hypothetical protein BDV95DRAFT_609791 [Massariosphaeria phaeospora]|uniref:Uncharacterized protein n=1 Tax=Massariosphaeria phaeospora TaxID=100035 RepID=A0A7C8M7X2_9PLEO|nr:hypothetical protein BDV95DRAFT_609791 [Massariosphaeria phaeospora]
MGRSHPNRKIRQRNCLRKDAENATRPVTKPTKEYAQEVAKAALSTVKIESPYPNMNAAKTHLIGMLGRTKHQWGNVGGRGDLERYEKNVACYMAIIAACQNRTSIGAPDPNATLTRIWPSSKETLRNDAGIDSNVRLDTEDVNSNRPPTQRRSHMQQLAKTGGPTKHNLDDQDYDTKQRDAPGAYDCSRSSSTDSQTSRASTILMLMLSLVGVQTSPTLTPHSTNNSGATSITKRAHGIELHGNGSNRETNGTNGTDVVAEKEANNIADVNYTDDYNLDLGNAASDPIPEPMRPRCQSREASQVPYHIIHTCIKYSHYN